MKERAKAKCIVHVHGAVAKSVCLGSRLRGQGGDLLHAYVGVAIRLCMAGPPKTGPHHQGRSSTEYQWLFVQDKLDDTSVLDDTWVLQLRRDEGDGA